MTRCTSLRAQLGLVALMVAALALWPTAADAQPFSAWITLSNAPSGYVEIPHSPALNPTEITVEAWVSLSASQPSCVSIVGKQWTEAWWLGVCNQQFRTYLQGQPSRRDAGDVPANEWTHIAMTYDGVRRRHFINGEEVGSWIEGSPTSSNAAVRIGSDVEFEFTPNGAIDEVRLWNVARTEDQLRETINQKLSSPQPGLVAVWGLDAGGADDLGVYNGVLVGTTPFLTFPVTFGCAALPPSTTTACIGDRFQVRIDWRLPNGTVNQAMLAPCGTADSAIFYFSNPLNWEVLVKTVDACGQPTPRFWIFSASTTNLFYRMTVTDIVAGAQKLYFNYAGPPAPAVTDTSAFATCP